MQVVEEIPAADEVHLVVQRAVVLESVVQSHDARVVQAIQRLYVVTTIVIHVIYNTSIVNIG